MPNVYNQRRETKTIDQKVEAQKSNSPFSLFSAGTGLGYLAYLFLDTDINSLEPRYTTEERDLIYFVPVKNRCCIKSTL